MSQNSSANVFDNIQAICREYRKRLKAGETLRLSDYLMRVEDSARETLFQNLLHLEIEFSRRQGESPSSEAYINRFPQFARLIRQAFFESTMMSQEYFGDTPDSAEPTVTLGIPAARKIGEYELLRELGRGGFGVVYEAKHLQRGDRLALKTLPNMARGSSLSSSDAERLHKFRREFRTLSEINHPNLAGMQTLEFDGDQWFFTMDLVDGVDFLDYVRPEGKFDESRLRRTAKQLARGVAALHDQGIVHRDLKPSNVLVDAAGHVTILDFGLVAELQQATDQTLSAQTKHFAGTPRYAAPEQADGNRNAACDWYALGVMFYEAITGTTPYSGSGVNLLLKKKSEDASSLAGREGLPNDLANLVDQLLRRNPQERPNFTAIADVLELASESTAQDSADTEQPTYSIDADTLLIGRESQLHSLDQAWMNVQERSEPGVVFVSGLSGEGKTTLVKRFLSEIRRSGGTLVLSGRCYDRESVPFKAVDSLIDALVAFLRSRSGEELGKWMPGDSHLLAHLFPSLRRVSSIEDRLDHDFGGISDRQLRYRAFFALKELLRGISRRMPIVLFVDDLQWGDGDSAEVLCGLLSPPDPLPILLVGTFRSDEVDDSSFLKEWRKLNESGGSTIELTQVPVEPLTQDQCVELVSSRIGVDVARLRERAEELYSDTRGNPYFLEQLIEGFDAATERFDPIPLDQMIARKLERLPDQSSALLESIAVAGQAVALSEAADVCQRPANAFSIVTHMRSEQLVRLIGSGDRQLVDTYHDKIRESVLEGLDGSREKKLHLRFGELLEASENISSKKVLQFLGEDSTDEEAMEPFATDRIFDLAYHFWAAGDGRGTAYQLMAAELSYRAYASEDVVEFLKRAQDSLDETVSDTVRFRFWERLASSSARLHQFDTALKDYDHALQYANSSDARARVRLGIARIHQFLGHYIDSTANFDHVLDEFAVRRPGVLGVMWRSPILAVKVFLIPRRWQRTSDVAQVTIASWEQKVYSSFCFHVFEVHHPIHYVYAMLRQASSAIRTGQSQRISLGLTELGGHLAFSGLVGIGQRMIERGSDPANDSDGDEATGKRLLYGGYALACSSQFERANAQYCEAIPVLIKCGLHTEAYICAHFQRHLHAVMSNTTLELQSAREVFRLAEESGNVQGRLWGRYDMAVAFARAGDLQSAADWIEQGRVCKGDNKMMATGVVFLAAQGFVHLQSSNYESARLVLEESWQTTAKQKVVNEYIVQALPWLIESYAGPNWLDDSRTPPMKRLRLLCQQAWVFLWLYPNLKPQIERARGRVYAALGKRKKAMRCLERSVRFAAKIGADYDLAKASLDLAAVKEEGRREMRSEAIRLLKKQESVIPYAERWLLGDQLDPEVVAPILPGEGSVRSQQEIGDDE